MRAKCVITHEVFITMLRKYNASKYVSHVLQRTTQGKLRFRIKPRKKEDIN